MMHIHSEQTVADLAPGDHLCCFYETEEEHRALVTAFLRRGLQQREKVLYVADARAAVTILDYLRNDGVEPEPYLDSGQLAMLTVDDSYMRGGVFDPDSMIALLQAETERALTQGYTALRVTGEMTWAQRGLPGAERLMEYESKLNEFLPRSKCLGMCQYDRRRFPPGVLLNVLRTHPIVVMGTRVYRNSYYVPPGASVRSEEEEILLRHWLEDLVAWNEAGEVQGQAKKE
jgi:hypothetical protein